MYFDTSLWIPWGSRYWLKQRHGLYLRKVFKKRNVYQTITIDTYLCHCFLNIDRTLSLYYNWSSWYNIGLTRCCVNFDILNCRHFLLRSLPRLYDELGQVLLDGHLEHLDLTGFWVTWLRKASVLEGWREIICAGVYTPIISRYCTLPKTNIAPENGGFQ